MLPCSMLRLHVCHRPSERQPHHAPLAPLPPTTHRPCRRPSRHITTATAITTTIIITITTTNTINTPNHVDNNGNYNNVTTVGDSVLLGVDLAPRSRLHLGEFHPAGLGAPRPPGRQPRHVTGGRPGRNGRQSRNHSDGCKCG